jgi:ribosomal protein L37E
MKDALAKVYKPASLNRCSRCGEPTIKKTCEACSLVAKVRKMMKSTKKG